VVRAQPARARRRRSTASRAPRTWHLDGVETAGTESLTLTLGLGDNDVGSQFWPEPFPCDLHRDLSRETLSLRLAVQNRAMPPDHFRGGAAQLLFGRLRCKPPWRSPGLAGTTYVDKTEGSAAQARRPAPASSTVGAETDRVYLDTLGAVHQSKIAGGAAAFLIEKTRRRIDRGMETLGPRRGAAHGRFRRPPSGRGMVCVENRETSPTTKCGLPRVGEHQMSTAISVDAGQ